LLKAGVQPDYSVLAQAAAWNVPIYTSSPGDSSIGMNVARNALDGSLLTLDPLADVNETTAIVHHATKNGVIILGGGAQKFLPAKHNPSSGRFLVFQKGGTISLFKSLPTLLIGGLSGATPSEAVSWAKSNPTNYTDAVVVYGDSTISPTSPYRHAVSKAPARLGRSSFHPKRRSFYKNSKHAYEAGKIGTPIENFRSNTTTPFLLDR